jgi:ubiquinone/menaquinone biosynthesis C-methylase UbiE
MKKEEKLTLKVYSKNPRIEWKRLFQDSFHKLEFDTTMYFLKKHLPKKGLILDAGGGPGRYTIELAKMGYDVVLLDFVPGNLALAKKIIAKEQVQNRVKAIIQGSIVDLSMFENNSFDTVLCLGGPLSHVHPGKDRKKAVSELIRVAKPNSPIALSVMGKFGTIMAGPRRWIQEYGNRKHAYDIALRGDDYMWHGKYFSHFFEREEFKKLVSNAGIAISETVGLEGLASPDPEAFNKMPKEHPKAYKNWMELHYKMCTNPTVVDVSGHMMIIGKKELK